MMESEVALGSISGWVCAANSVEIRISNAPSVQESKRYG